MHRYPVRLTYKDHTVIRKTSADTLENPELVYSIVNQCFPDSYPYILSNEDNNHKFFNKQLFFEELKFQSNNEEEICQGGVLRPLNESENFINLSKQHNQHYGSHIYIFDNDSMIHIPRNRLDQIIELLNNLRE